MTKSNIAVLIIAAGYSSRMNDFKPLLPFGETTALERLIQTYEAMVLTTFMWSLGIDKRTSETC